MKKLNVEFKQISCFSNSIEIQREGLNIRGIFLLSLNLDFCYYLNYYYYYFYYGNNKHNSSIKFTEFIYILFVNFKNEKKHEQLEHIVVVDNDVGQERLPVISSDSGIDDIAVCGQFDRRGDSHAKLSKPWSQQ